MAFKMKGFSAFTKTDDKKTKEFIMAGYKQMLKDGKSDSEIKEFVNKHSDKTTEYVHNPDTNEVRAYDYTKEGKKIKNVDPEKGKSITD